MMTTYPGGCRYCAVPLSLEIDDEYMRLGGGLFGDIPTLVKLAACNRCGDYMNAKRRLRDEMEKVARTLSLELFARRGVSDVAENARENMRILFDKWFNVVCDHFLITTQRDDNFVRMIFERPEKWANAFYNYEKGCRMIAEDARRLV